MARTYCHNENNRVPVMQAVQQPPSEQRASYTCNVIVDVFPELATDTSDLIRSIKEGLPPERVDALKELLDVPASHLTDLLSIAPSTLSRRRAGGQLDRDESERTVRLARLLAQAADVMGSLEAARRWLKEPQIALGDTAPLAYADTEPGAREVERLLIRIDHGIPV